MRSVFGKVLLYEITTANSPSNSSNVNPDGPSSPVIQTMPEPLLSVTVHVAGIPLLKFS